jgi:hypothetical protein
MAFGRYHSLAWMPISYPEMRPNARSIPNWPCRSASAFPLEHHCRHLPVAATRMTVHDSADAPRSSPPVNSPFRPSLDSRRFPGETTHGPTDPSRPPPGALTT